jgi:NhaP-type Na+/H+ or K+/H+ antiporter
MVPQQMVESSLAVLAALVVAFGTFSGRLQRSFVTPAMFFVTAGFIVGSQALGWVSLEVKSTPVKLLAESTLAVLLFADASRIDLVALRRGIGVPARLLCIGLPLTIVAGTVAALATLSGLTVAEALVLAIVLAPTDAALGQAVVTDQRLPARIRQGLNVESGLNDGICVPLLFIALAVAEAEGAAMSGAEALHLVLQEIGWGVVGGAAAGLAGALSIRVAGRRGLGDRSWLPVIPAATALLAYTVAVTLGGSGFIAAFVGGLVFGAPFRSADEHLTSLVDQAGEFLNAITFALFGAVILGSLLGGLTWRTVLYAVLSLTVVRMVPVALAMLGTRAALPTVGYLGWFGPRGLASIVFAVIVLEQARLHHIEVILASVVVTVTVSVYAHGLTAIPLTERYVRWYRRHGTPPGMESAPVADHRWRRPPPPGSGG